MNKDWSAAFAKSGMMAMATAAYAMKEEPTKEELASELDAAKKSHAHANRALTNMAVALSDSMDHVVALQEAARKTKLEHEARAAGLVRETKRLDEEVVSLKKRLTAETERLTAELATERARAEAAIARLSDRVAHPDTPHDPLPVVHLNVVKSGAMSPEWCVGSREKGANGERDVIGLFHNEATARWFAERWRP